MDDAARFIERWKNSGAAERANYQLFLIELCDLLGVARPEPATSTPGGAYAFERAVVFANPDGSTSRGYIDLYKRGCFVLEAKQGSDRLQPVKASDPSPARKAKRGTAVRGTRAWDSAMLEARGQAERYVRALPADEPNPPFILVVDVGHTIELYSDFTRQGKTYVPFPDARSHRLTLDRLADEETRERLKLVWKDPASLDPARLSARVTREVAARLARLAKSLEDAGHPPGEVAAFLMRAIFTMFAEDVRLIPERKFTELLEELRQKPAVFADMMRSLWQTMNTGGYFSKLEINLVQFDGGLFESAGALALDAEQVALLIEAARAEWRDVEPAIFGTLLERALDPVERHKLGAHYTPRAYVERLVMPTIIEPLREDWEAAKAAAVQLANGGREDEAIQEVARFHRRLCETRVLDPACGSGNFLYVTLEHLKRLEGEVLDQLHALGERQAPLLTVDPRQLMGIEVNPRAAAIADLVLWIGYLQWHFRTRGDANPPVPVLRRYHNIECRDAVLAYDEVEPVTDEAGRAVTRWDGRTYKKHPVTGEDVPDDAARVPLLKYVNARKADWPESDFIIGNPPFIGAKYIRFVLGDGYAEALRQTYKEVPESSDYVMYWWDHAATFAREAKVRRFGLIATNSLRQTFNRRVVQSHLSAKNPLSLVFAIPDHPWVDAADGAAVRISMTVGEAGEHSGTLLEDVGDDEYRESSYYIGKILADLSIGASVSEAQPLLANKGICSRGVQLIGAGFIVTPDEAKHLGLGRIPNLENHIKPYRNGRDVTGLSRNVMVIDLFGLKEKEVQTRFPEVYQWVFERVKPERDHNNRITYRDNWWIHGEPRTNFRPAINHLTRFVSTPATSKHRFFLFLSGNVLPDDALISIACEDAFILGVLASRIHIVWALAAGGTLEDRPRYNNSLCFDPFPFPDCDEEQKARIRELGESLDAHRKRQQSLHPRLTITDMYNVLDKLRSRAPLNDKEKSVHEQGLVSVLGQIHDELDREVFAAYGWPATLTDDQILARLVDLNAERAAEERRGIIRWLRPEFQNPQRATQAAFAEDEAATQARASLGHRAEWPRTLAEQARAVRNALASRNEIVTAEQLARSFKSARSDRVAELLKTLASLGQAREVEPGRFTT